MCERWRKIEWRTIENILNFSLGILSFLARQKLWFQNAIVYGFENTFVVPCSPSIIRPVGLRIPECWRKIE